MVVTQSVEDAVSAWLDSLDLDLVGAVRASVVRRLAAKLDAAAFSQSGAVAVAVPSIAKELRNTVAEISGDLRNDDELMMRLFGASS